MGKGILSSGCPGLWAAVVSCGGEKRRHWIHVSPLSAPRLLVGEYGAIHPAQGPAAKVTAGDPTCN